ncbi:hypothetical protein [Microbacterium sp.]|uniref:hypothetical protein n=1 Tax=Microbacterium sp. TaxID=51671 RepID=UPI001AC95FA1|nr:hypothetical protein [Microbacterium sp.]MBN9193953.1 hypothetical protein [Microbacterium sp.]
MIIGVVAIMVALAGAQPTSAPNRTSVTPASPSPPASSSPPYGAVVDPSVAKRGWVAEPITTDPKRYIESALEAASTFDTTKSDRDAWLAYLDSWFTPDTRYTSTADQDAAMQSSRLELRQGVVLPESDWNSLGSEQGRVKSRVEGEVTFVPVSDDASGDMRIGTANVTLTYTRSNGSGGETSYEDHARVSVQLLCGPGSVPTPDTAQQAGDCKVVRYFTGPMEP